MPSIDIDERVNITVHDIDDEQLAVLWGDSIIERISFIDQPAQPFVSITVALPMVSITYYWTPSERYLGPHFYNASAWIRKLLIETLINQGEGEAGQIEGQVRKFEGEEAF